MPWLGGPAPAHALQDQDDVRARLLLRAQQLHSGAGALQPLRSWEVGVQIVPARWRGGGVVGGAPGAGYRGGLQLPPPGSWGARFACL